MRLNHVYSSAIAVLAAILAVYYVPKLAPKIYNEAYGHVLGLKKSAAAEKIMGASDGFLRRESKDVVVYYTGQDEEYARVIERIISVYLPLLMKDFELDGSASVTVIIFPNEKHMYSAIGFKDEDRGLLPIGAYSAGLLAVLSPVHWAEDKNISTGIDAIISEGPVIHELAHFVLDKKTKGNAPEWFSEGTALFYENKYTGYEWQASNGQAATYKELSGGFKNISTREAYRKSGEIINFIEKEAGTAGLKRIYNMLEEGKGIDAAVKAVLGDKFPLLDEL